MEAVSTVVIIPVLNVAATIQRQLDALDRQTVLDFRVVVSDNGSTDGTATLCCRWQPRFAGLEVVDASTRRGVAHARNVGISMSREPYILICDGDDRVHPSWVESMRDGLAQADGVTGPLHLIFPGRPEVQVLNADALPTSMNHRPYLPGGNLGVRRTVVEAVGMFDEDMHLGQEDVDFGWRLSTAGFTLGHHKGASLDYFQRDGTVPLIRQQFRYGRSHVALYLKYRDAPDAPTPASLRHSFRWFLMWAGQFPNRLRSGTASNAIGQLAFQLGRMWECVARRTLSPL